MIRRVFRDMKSEKGWVVSIAILIAVSIGIYSSFRSIYDSAMACYSQAREALRSPDIMVSTVPCNDFSSKISEIPGVSMVSPSFTVECYTFMDGGKIRGQVIGVQPGVRVDDYEIVEGRDLEADGDLVVEHHFANNHKVMIGQNITVYINGEALNFTVCGICFSPDYIYLVSPEGWFVKDFGIFYIKRRVISQSVNTFYVKVSGEGKIGEVLEDIRLFFKERGINAVVMLTNETFSYTSFKEDIGGMNSLANLFSSVLMLTSAFIIFVTLMRKVERNRREIGTLRAMGFTKSSIFSYYMMFSLTGLVIGAFLSIPVGYEMLSYIMGYWGVKTLGIPGKFITYRLNIAYVCTAAAYSLLSTSLGAFLPSYHAASLKPAEAMRPFIASKKGSRVMYKSAVSPLSKLVFRNLIGRRARSISTAVSIGLVLSLGLSFALTINSFKEGAKRRFSENELWDIRINFIAPQNISAIRLLESLEGIERVEPYTSLKCEMLYRGRSTVVQLNILPEDTKMRIFTLKEGKAGPDGIIISGDIAHRLGLRVEDRVLLNTPFGRSETKIIGILGEFGSSEGYMLADQARFTGALIKIKEGMEEKAENQVKKLTIIRSWIWKDEFLEGWLDLLEEYHGMIYAMDTITLLLILIVVGVFRFISIMEAEWSFTILKTIGFSDWEIAKGHLSETLILTTVGILMSIPVSIHLATLLNKSFENLMSPPPTVLNAGVVFYRAAIVLTSTLLVTIALLKYSLKGRTAEKLRKVFEAI